MQFVFAPKVVAAPMFNDCCVEKLLLAEFEGMSTV
jgi:hypothetical protein